MDEMSRPIDSETKMNTKDTITSQKRLPVTGTPSRKTERNNIVVRLTIESTKYGTALDSIKKIGRTGDTRRTSIVPVSFSLTIDIEVIIAQMSISINPITP